MPKQGSTLIGLFLLFSNTPYIQAFFWDKSNRRLFPLQYSLIQIQYTNINASTIAPDESCMFPQSYLHNCPLYVPVYCPVMPFITMSQTFDMHKDDDLLYLLKTMLSPFGPYDEDSFSYNVLNSLYQTWFSQNISFVNQIHQNCSRNFDDYCQNYHVMKRNLLDYFDARPDSWVNDESYYWNNDIRFHLLFIVIRDKSTRQEQILATKVRLQWPRSGYSEMRSREIRISFWQKTGDFMNAAGMKLRALNSNWEFIVRLIQQIY